MKKKEIPHSITENPQPTDKHLRAISEYRDHEASDEVNERDNREIDNRDNAVITMGPRSLLARIICRLVGNMKWFGFKVVTS